MASSIPPNYVLGQSEYEYERLTLQARVVRPFTEKFFRMAGVAPGMRVLDLGSGMGDVALLAADIDRFDAIVGRYILLYQHDPGATIRHLLRFLKPGGIVVFHEIDLTDTRSSDPPC